MGIGLGHTDPYRGGISHTVSQNRKGKKNETVGVGQWVRVFTMGWYPQTPDK